LIIVIYPKYRRKQKMTKTGSGGRGEQGSRGGQGARGRSGGPGVPGGSGGPGASAGCCGVEAVVTVDARGQIVLPKELRELAGIGSGDKLAVVSMRSAGRVCCLSLMKVEELSGTVRDILGPVARELSTGGKNDA
jgi:antitoxin PrlF